MLTREQNENLNILFILTKSTDMAAALRPSADLRRSVGRPRTTWLTTIDDDLQSLIFGVHMAWRKARDRDVWHQVISMAMLHPGVRQ